MAYPLKALDIIISPISIPMQKATLGIHKKLGKQKSTLNVGHLSQALELASDEDTTQEEQKILQGIVSFGNTDTKQVMRPRIDIFALPGDWSFYIREMDGPALIIFFLSILSFNFIFVVFS